MILFKVPRSTIRQDEITAIFVRDNFNKIQTILFIVTANIEIAKHATTIPAHNSSYSEIKKFLIKEFSSRKGLLKRKKIIAIALECSYLLSQPALKLDQNSQMLMFLEQAILCTTNDQALLKRCRDWKFDKGITTFSMYLKLIEEAIDLVEISYKNYSSLANEIYEYMCHLLTI